MAPLPVSSAHLVVAGSVFLTIIGAAIVSSSSAPCDFASYRVSGCPHPSSVCELFRCECSPTAPLRLDTSTGHPVCLELSSVGEACFVTNQCSHTDRALECAPESGGDAENATRTVLRDLQVVVNITSELLERFDPHQATGHCACKSGFFSKVGVSHGYCLRSRKHGEGCKEPEECSRHDGNSFCKPRHRFKACACKPGYLFNRTFDRCVLDMDEALKVSTVEEEESDDVDGPGANCPQGDLARAKARPPNCSEHEDSEDKVDPAHDRVLGTVVSILCIAAFLITCSFVCFCHRNKNKPRVRTSNVHPTDNYPLGPHGGTVLPRSTPRRKPSRELSLRTGGTRAPLAPLPAPFRTGSDLSLVVTPDTDRLYWTKMDKIGSGGIKSKKAGHPPSYEEATSLSPDGLSSSLKGNTSKFDIV